MFLFIELKIQYSFQFIMYLFFMHETQLYSISEKEFSFYICNSYTFLIIQFYLFTVIHFSSYVLSINISFE